MECSARVNRNDSRSMRFSRLRTTAPPTRLPIESPSLQNARSVCNENTVSGPAFERTFAAKTASYSRSCASRRVRGSVNRGIGWFAGGITNCTESLRQERHGPLIASVNPSPCMLTNIVDPSGEKHTPANSLSLLAL